MTNSAEILRDIETHNFSGIRQYFQTTGSPNELLNGIPLFTIMVEMYLRSPRFSECIKVFIEYGLEIEFPELLAVLANDHIKLKTLLQASPGLVNKKYFQYNNAFTSLKGATLLHFCAEYNHVNCARELITRGAEVDARAHIDTFGFGGQTPLFHTVNQHADNSNSMRRFLLQANANPNVQVQGLIWGQGYEWETFLPAINPISYSKMGCLPQMQRDEVTISNAIRELISVAFQIDYIPANVPNKYLKE